jgi:hypothetical protein
MLSRFLFSIAALFDRLSWWLTVQAEQYGEGNEVIR